MFESLSNSVEAFLLGFLPELWVWLFFKVVQVVCVTVVVILCVAYLTYFERKIIGYMQNRIGPNRVGPLGIIQPFADVFKLLLKEIILTTNSHRFLFLLATIIALAPAFATWEIVPFNGFLVLADVDAGLI